MTHTNKHTHIIHTLSVGMLNVVTLIVIAPKNIVIKVTIGTYLIFKCKVGKVMDDVISPESN